MLKSAHNTEFKVWQVIIILSVAVHFHRGCFIRQHKLSSHSLPSPNEWLVTGYLLVFPGSCRPGCGPTAAGPGHWTGSRRRRAPATWRPPSVYRQRDRQSKTMLWRYTDLFCNCSATNVRTWPFSSTLWKIWNDNLPEKQSNSIFRCFFLMGERGLFFILNYMFTRH